MLSGRCRRDAILNMVILAVLSTESLEFSPISEHFDGFMIMQVDADCTGANRERLATKRACLVAIGERGYRSISNLSSLTWNPTNYGLLIGFLHFKLRQLLSVDLDMDTVAAMCEGHSSNLISHREVMRRVMAALFLLVGSKQSWWREQPSGDACPTRCCDYFSRSRATFYNHARFTPVSGVKTLVNPS